MPIAKIGDDGCVEDEFVDMDKRSSMKMWKTSLDIFWQVVNMRPPRYIYIYNGREEMSFT
jgi:hypothetical protein